MRRLVGGGVLWLSPSISGSCPLARSGMEKDFGEDGSEDIMLLKYFGGGSKKLIRGLVIKPNTWETKRSVKEKAAPGWEAFLSKRCEVSYQCTEKDNCDCAGDHDRIPSQLGMAWHSELHGQHDMCYYMTTSFI